MHDDVEQSTLLPDLNHDGDAGASGSGRGRLEWLREARGARVELTSGRP